MPSHVNAHPGVITQAELRELKEDRALKRELEEKIERSRRRIMERDTAGVPVEPGRLTYRIVSKERPRFTKKALVEVLGETEVERISLKVTPIESFYVLVESAKDRITMPQRRER